jgi:alkylated DNA repair protein alkB family protein 1
MGSELMEGVPRIMEGTLPSHFSVLDEDSEVEKAVKGYIASGRVNINARQVFPPGFKRS